MATDLLTHPSRQRHPPPVLTGRAAAGLLTAGGTDEAATATGTAATGFPRTVQHAGGSTRSPLRPPHPAALGTQDQLQAVDYDVLTTAVRPECDIEQLAAQRPDLITIADSDVDLFGTLTAVAPQELLLVGDALGLRRCGVELLDEPDTAIAATRDALRRDDRTVSAVRIRPDSIWTFSSMWRGGGVALGGRRKREGEGSAHRAGKPAH